jgi:hypothetical protein
LCVGFQAEPRDGQKHIVDVGEEIKEILREHLGEGFDLDYAAKYFAGPNSLESGAVMMANQRFASMFPRGE